MSYFTDTKETIPEGLGIVQFGPEHLCWLGAIAASLVLLCRWAKNASPEGKQRLERVLAGLLLADELFKQGMLLAFGRWQVDYLPLHVCSINILICLVHALRPNRLTGESLYAVGLPSAAMALVFPSWTALPAWNFMSIHSFTVHGLLVLYPAVLLAGGSLRPQARNLKWVTLFFVVLGVGLYAFNQHFGTNFMFLRSPGTGNPLVWFEAWLGTPGYIVGLPILAWLIWLAIYGLPALWRRRRAQRA